MDRITIIKGSLEICVLSILYKKRSYGYEIMKELEQFNIKLKGVGSIYPILTRIKEKQLVNVYKEFGDDERPRIYYELNDLGVEFLRRELNEWFEIQHDIQALLAKNASNLKEEK
ncbi:MULTISPECIES: PadR family transcriptional regulator [Cytobacillus]|jgi:PadR family transcriptional regulator, regulatory protein PadR|uniref:PadR family transcriptional regulator n=1 Tax=Cytobacillus oceanisediminis 2691 TaxID=1196031 RepID=A0A160M7R8_9BACI|nr:MULTISPECIES: PadR family transcriptional regulator [Cytobacillus]AND38334.1 PadR family transcriptional regulator [Cytobacillus oceanisediminis 2691]MBY0156691.1 PadR family transcriptional regulator [Cytobacillus firmus]MCM3242104.1 PadR family transcriptional regulator [Cytobacillus oceanisediminis]MCM3391189.1 PadR family transcriptional regulator [Cytobacillus oceanisediminis]MCM3531440.1 PadR family transcriptional regulator [Cytobacillus oceanisediminis]